MLIFNTIYFFHRIISADSVEINRIQISFLSQNRRKMNRRIMPIFHGNVAYKGRTILHLFYNFVVVTLHVCSLQNIQTFVSYIRKMFSVCALAIWLWLFVLYEVVNMNAATTAESGTQKPAIEMKTNMRSNSGNYDVCIVFLAIICRTIVIEKKWRRSNFCFFYCWCIPVHAYCLYTKTSDADNAA